VTMALGQCSNTEGGDDSINISAIANRLVMDTGAGRDDVHISSSNTGELNIQLGLDNDNLDLMSDYTNLLIAHGSSGDDLFLVRNTRAIDAYFHGEAGTDTYQDSV
jgi:hypothetical protein